MVKVESWDSKSIVEEAYEMRENAIQSDIEREEDTEKKNNLQQLLEKTTEDKNSFQVR